MLKAGLLGGVMFSILAQNVRDVGMIPALGTIFPNFITPVPYLTNLITYTPYCPTWIKDLVVIHWEAVHEAVLSLSTRCQHLFPVQENPSVCEFNTKFNGTRKR